jgi:N-acetylmuramoyl-L-alanine amidase
VILYSGKERLVTVVSVIIAFLLSATALAEAPSIRVQYPNKGQRIPTVDSTFIFGEVTPGSELEVNGQEVSVHKHGGFLAFVDVEPGEFVFVLKATRKGKTSTLDWPVSIADRYRAVPRDSLAILNAYQHPNVDQELVPGDLVEVSFRGTPGGTASFAIEGVIENVQMTESGLLYENVWGSEVFGAGAVEERITVAGSYKGSIYIPDSAQIDKSRVIFKLLVPADQIDSTNLSTDTQRLIDESTGHYLVEDTAKGRITVVRHEYPQVVEMIDSVQTIRTGPRKGYLSIFQPRGIRFVCDGRYSNYVRLRLAPGQPTWVPDTSVVFLPSGTPVPHSYISSIRCTGMQTRTRIEVFLDEKLPFQIEEIPEKDQFVLRIFQATSDTDWIRYLGSKDLIERINWSQEQAGVYRLVIGLKDHPRIWGWNGYYSGNVLTLDIKPGPEYFGSYKGLRIMVDPGHSKDPGAIGPTGLTEAEANLMIADRLAALLRKKGATVFMTRTDDSDVKLYDRPRMTVEKDCDIFISVHNNAVPDGVNPFVAHGTSTYYYNAHSKSLAEFVQDRLLKKLDAKDHGLYYANFAVTRPSQYLAILVECAFMILPEQEAALRTEAFQAKCALAIANGLDDYLRSLDKH